jgi:perosamine synthetase
MNLMPLSFEPCAPIPEGFIPLCVPKIRGNEWKYLENCLETNLVSSVGPFVDRFEKAVSDYVGTKHSVATVNGTAALHTALLVAGVRTNDEVLISTLTFISPANAIRYVGAWPVFIDAEPEYWQIDPLKVVDFLEKECHWTGKELLNATTGRRVKAVIVVHILGHPADIDPIVEVAQKYDLCIIEDAAESFGSRYRGRMVGHLGNIACLSFNGNKIITTGGGGMILTDSEELARKARYLTTQAKDDQIEYIHNEIGYNYRLTNIQAAIGCAQMEVLDEYINIKRKISEIYIKLLEDIEGITPMKEADWAFSIFWLFTILIDKQKYGIDRKRLFLELYKEGIQSRPLWQPLHRSKAHLCAQNYQIEIAERLQDCALSLPSSVGISSIDQYRVIQSIERNRTTPTY